ncbi:MAG: outer membrane beta-barrel protein [Gallionella sp.]
MSAIRRGGVFAASLLLCCIGMQPQPAFAETYLKPGKFLFGGWAGLGHVSLDANNGTGRSKNALALGFRAGYATTSRALIGVEFNGWTLKSYNFNDPSSGESISNFSAFIHYLPMDDSPVFVTGGAGITSYANNTPAASGRDNGGSWFVGTGYEYPISGQLMLEPQIRYSHGDFSGGKYHVIEMAVGVSWQAR